MGDLAQWLSLRAKSQSVGSIISHDLFRYTMDDLHFRKVEIQGGNYKSRQALIEMIIRVAASRGISKTEYTIRVAQHRAVFRKCNGAAATVTSKQYVVAGIIHDELLKCGELHSKTKLFKAKIDVDRRPMFGEARSDIEATRKDVPAVQNRRQGDEEEQRYAKSVQEAPTGK